MKSTTSPAASHQSGASGSTTSNERQSTGSTIPDPLSVEEYGRLFNAYREGKYLLPNDGDEQDRLDLQHHQWRLFLDGKLYLAPIGHPADVLDIGTGTGIWAKQFAKMHPDAQVIGTDISLIQPREALPPNLTFVREDSEELWVFDKLFDYIRWRLMFTCFNDFPAMFAKILENLKPGGWAEFHETGAELIPTDEAAAAVLHNSTFQKCWDHVIQAGAKMGRDFDAPRKYKRWLIEAGFEDVIEKQILVPVNPWSLDRQDNIMGKWLCLNLLKFAGNLPKFLTSTGVPAEDVPGYQERFVQDVVDPKMRVYAPQYVVYGRKPLGKDRARTAATSPANSLSPNMVSLMKDTKIQDPNAVSPPPGGVKIESPGGSGMGATASIPWAQPQAAGSQYHVFSKAPSYPTESPAETFVGAKRKKPPEA